MTCATRSTPSPSRRAHQAQRNRRAARPRANPAQQRAHEQHGRPAPRFDAHPAGRGHPHREELSQSPNGGGGRSKSYSWSTAIGKFAWNRRGIDGLWDTDRLAQVVSNLVGNALEHGAPDRPVTVRLSAADDIVRLSVHSFGPPIPPEILSMIFDPYRRTTARSGRSKGLGLGLFIAQQIVVAHGGAIDCRSTARGRNDLRRHLPGGVAGRFRRRGALVS